MYLNQFEKSTSIKLKQLLHTLEAVHGVKLTFDWASPTVKKDLLETKQAYEQAKNSIVQNSNFNSYQQNPEYAKSILILEAVKIMLTEISPKRRRARSVKETFAPLIENLIDTFGTEGKEVRIYRNGRSNNYVVKVYKNNVHQPEFDAIADTEDEAREVVDDRLRTKSESLTTTAHSNYDTETTIAMNSVDERRSSDEILKNKGQHMTSNTTRILENALYQQHDYEYQASMARSELYRNAKYAMSMLKQIDPNSEVPPWIAGALTKAANYLDKVFHYLDYYKKFEPEKLPGNMDEDLELGETSGSVTRENLMLVVEYSIKLFNMIQPGEKLEGWVAMKLTTASESISSCKHYLDYVQFEQHGLDSHFDDGRRAIKRKMDESTLLEADSAEDLQRAQTIITAKEMSDDVQKIAEKSAELSVEILMPLVDTMRSYFGVDAANGFNEVVKTALDELLASATKSKEKIDEAISTLQGGGVPGQMSDIEKAGDQGEEVPGADFDNKEPPADETPPEPQEPLGRAKKVSESRFEYDKKTGQMKLNSEDPDQRHGLYRNGKLVRATWTKDEAENLKTRDKNFKDCEIKKISESKSNTQLNEKSPPGKKAEKWIKSNKKRFIDQYGKKKGLSVLYAKAWDMFGESTDAYSQAKTIVETKKKMVDNLQRQLYLHKRQFAESVAVGNTNDPLAVGYGLEGELLVQQINSLTNELKQASSIVVSEMKKGINALLEQLENLSKADEISKVKSTTPYGVIYTRNSKLSKKMFETVEIRDYWIQLNSPDVSDVKLIEPETFDKAITSIIKGK